MRRYPQRQGTFRLQSPQCFQGQLVGRGVLNRRNAEFVVEGCCPAHRCKIALRRRDREVGFYEEGRRLDQLPGEFAVWVLADLTTEGRGRVRVNTGQFQRFRVKKCMGETNLRAGKPEYSGKPHRGGTCAVCCREIGCTGTAPQPAIHLLLVPLRIP